MKKNIVTESQYMKIIDGMAYPVSFNMAEFKTLKTFTARIKYCQARLQRISSGSARIVYKIDNEKVLKLAKSRKGIAQNEAEGSDYYKSKQVNYRY